jgi:hypothetical protein
MSFQKTVPPVAASADYQATQAGPSPVAQAIQAGGEIAGQTIKDVQKNALEADVQQSADVVTAVGGAVAEGGRSIFDPEGEINTEGLSPDLQQQIQRVKATAGDKFKRIANAVKQGALPESAAALETEATVRRLMTQTPGFAQEIKQLARELVGFDPTGYALRKIFDVNQPAHKPTAQEKRVAEAQVIVDGYRRAGKDITLDSVLTTMAQHDMIKLEQENLNNQLDIKTINTQQWAQSSFVARGPDLIGSLQKIATLGAAEGIREPQQYVNAVVQQREEAKAAFRQGVALRGGMDATAAAAIEDQIDAQYEPLIKSITDNEMGKVLETKLDVIVKLNALWGKQATPRLTRIIDAYGPTIGGQLLEMMSNIADPKQFELIYQFDPKLKELILGGKVTQADVAGGVQTVIDKTTSGDTLTEDDLTYRNLAETMVVQPGNKEVREKYVRSLGDNGAPIRAVSILSEKVPRANATQDEVKFMKDQFDTYVGTTATENIPGNLIDSIAREVMELVPGGVRGQLQLQQVTSRSVRTALMGLPPKPTGQTKLVIPFDPSQQGTAVNFQTTSMKRLQPFMDAVISKGYSADLGVSKASFGNDIIARVNARIEKIRAAEAPAKSATSQGAPKGEKNMYTAIYNPSMVTGWALPENRPVPLQEISPDQYVEAVRMVESGGDQTAVSPVGAIGSMQVMPATADNPGFGLKPAKKNEDGSYDLNDIDRLGKEYIQKMLERYDGDFEAALVAYNAGPGNADKWLAANKDYSVLPKREETEQYVAKAFDQLKNITGSKK